MNAPFKPPVVEEILADAFVSISKLKANPATVIAEAQERQVAILSRNRPVAYVISPQVWEYLCDLVEELGDAEIVRERLAEPVEPIEVSLDDLV